MRILLIHGRAQGGKNPLLLKETWIHTLKKGFQTCNRTLPSNISIDFPFYGDKLDELTAEADLPTPADVIKRGPGTNKDFEQFVQVVIEEMRTTRQISDKDILKFTGRVDVQERGIQNWSWVRAIAQLIDNFFTDASDFTIETFLKDVYLYVNSPKVSAEINKIVVEKLTKEPTIIISHSLGTVVGYKIILEYFSKINLVKFVTVGSPLGIKAISTKLGLPENPAKLGWFNAFDKRDIVALHPLDDEYFPTLRPIINYDSVDNQTSNRHGIIGYLNDTKVAKEVASAISDV
jgi:hypothetical protein